ncbi:MAG: glycosyltransferase [Candidatus Altiarchaeales archaeon]|nr:glycosyltransferase [Candidatus Altiarchaeales archaeon]MBD3415634.1 glycosyltransferase [Candidatus Altiarchaeales archaeon]
MVSKPAVSVVIPCYNAEDTIDDCITSLLNLEYPKEKSEFIFVDDGSTDSTREKIRGYETVNLVEQQHKGPAAARNRGVKNSKGEVIVFTDADCEVPADWLDKIVRALEESNAVGGSLRPASSGTYAERFEQHRRDRLYGMERKHVDALPSCNLAFKKNLLDEARGFDEDFKKASAEDYDLCRRITEKGHDILFEPDIYVVHHHSQTLKGILKRAYTHGMEMTKYRRKMGKGPLNELVRAFAKLAVTPVLVLKRYPPDLMPLGLAYELVSFAGNLNGALKHRA